MRAARLSFASGLLVLSLLLVGLHPMRADSAKEAEAKRMFEAERTKKLVAEAQAEAFGRLLRTNPSKALELLHSALDVLENDRSLAPDRRESLMRQLRLHVQYVEVEARERKRLAEKKVPERDSESLFKRLGLSQRDLELIVEPPHVSEYPPMAEAVHRATKVVLYEGLPHQLLAEDRLKEEQQTKKTVEIHKYHFYQEVLPLTKEDAQKLKDAFCNPASFSPWSWHRRCGFHPDYCIEWQDGTDVYHVLICLGCHEAKLYGPKTELRCNVLSEAYKQFQTVFKPYRKNRPEEKRELDCG